MKQKLYKSKQSPKRVIKINAINKHGFIDIAINTHKGVNTMPLETLEHEYEPCTTEWFDEYKHYKKKRL